MLNKFKIGKIDIDTNGKKEYEIKTLDSREIWKRAVPLGLWVDVDVK
jgi:hypothetical protein